MLFIVLAEVLVPSGTLPQPLEMVLGVRKALRRSRRYAQISRITVRHGLGPYLRGRRGRGTDAVGGRAALAQSLRQALEELGFHILEIRVIERKLPLQGTIRHASTALDYGQGLLQNLLKAHSGLSFTRVIMITATQQAIQQAG